MLLCNSCKNTRSENYGSFKKLCVDCCLKVKNVEEHIKSDAEQFSMDWMKDEEGNLLAPDGTIFKKTETNDIEEW